MKRISKMFLFVSALLFAAVGFAKDAQQKNACEPAPCDSCSNWCVVEDTAPANCGYNCPARINPKCEWDFDIYGVYLYWQAREKGIEVQEHNTTVTTSSLASTSIDVQNMDFDFHSAFKVGVGMNSSMDNWTTDLQYTRVNLVNHKSFFIPSSEYNTTVASLNIISDYWNSEVYDQFGTSGSTPSSFGSKAAWKLDLNVIDFVVGRPYWLGTKLTISPVYGVRGGWINQTFNKETTSNLNFTPIPITSYLITLKFTSKTWLIGPRVGFGSNWLLGAGFRFFGNAYAGLNYQNFKIHGKNEVPIQKSLTVAQEYKISQKVAYINPCFDGSLGFGWGSYFNDKSWHFDLTAGYEFQWYANQNGFNSAYGERHNKAEAGSLMLHGLTVAAKFDF
jgi:hypothetical protein